ncbi:acyltransferase family protein [Myxococcus landrumensis]|uniref:Acyltransferase n=1 Tax=Myxococcus landrumensis TaxID=2813577 RepID=A0ABX7N6F3_9BACT|nr:acyltransferase [Myxococcus landrumus]QSQ14310.1 acyltransferase [Myxococcus landrumus]
MSTPAPFPASPSESHRPDLDWLRVVAILVLHFFHTGMMFNTWDWHLKSPVALPSLEWTMDILHHVRMPLLMVISGVGTALALRHRSVRAFAGDRARRLLVPVLFGMLVVVPPQIYVERVFRGEFQGGYADFYPSVFALVPYPAGSLSWHHLWFVVYLFVYCVLALPLFALLGQPRAKPWLEKLEAWLCRGANGVWLAAPLVLNDLWLHTYPVTHALVDDPQNFGHYGLLFLMGHTLGRAPRLWEVLVERRWVLLGVSAVLFAVMAPENEFPLVPEMLGRGTSQWLFILTALAWARRSIQTRRPWLRYAAERSYPFYILHQTVIIVVGFALLRLPVGPWTLFACVLVSSFLATWVLSEAVARLSWLRPFFGLKARAPRARPAIPAASPGHTA